MIRGFFTGNALRYSEDGSPVQTGPPDSWTMAEIRIGELLFEPGRLRIAGHRSALSFQQSSRRFKRERHGKQPVVIEFALADSNDEAAIRRSLSRVFHQPEEDIAPLLPDYWREFVQELKVQSITKKSFALRTPAGAIVELPDGTRAYRPGRGVKMPRAVSLDDPHYDQEARNARFQGTVWLEIIVSPTGEVSHIWLIQPLGAGLDEKAVAAVKKWRFEPAQKDGHPIAAVMNVEVSFKLY